MSIVDYVPLYEMWVGMRASVTDTVHTHRRLFLLGSPSRAFLGCVAQNAVASSLFSLLLVRRVAARSLSRLLVAPSF